MRNASVLHWTLLVALLAFPIVAPAQRTSDDRRGSKSGLQIEYGPNQGLTHTDTLGTKHNYRYITATITNDSTIAIHLQIALSNEYDFPAACGDKKYKVFLLPKELTPDTAALINVITNGLGNFLDRCLDTPYILNKTLEPGEKSVVTFGTLYSRPTNCGVVPNALFAQGDSDNFQACDSLMNQDKSTDPQLALGLKLDFYSGRSPFACILIPCGQISYPEP